MKDMRSIQTPFDPISQRWPATRVRFGQQPARLLIGSKLSLKREADSVAGLFWEAVYEHG